MNSGNLEKDLLRYYRNPVILDTGPLVFLLIGLYDLGTRNAKDIWQGRTQEELDLLLKIIKPFKGVIITPQILAECTNLLNRNVNSTKYQFLLSRFVQPLKEYGEVHINKDVILDYSEFPRFGSTDIGIIECSKKMDSLIITEDSNLEIFCRSNKIPCLNFNIVKPSIWH